MAFLLPRLRGGRRFLFMMLLYHRRPRHTRGRRRTIHSAGSNVRGIRRFLRLCSGFLSKKHRKKDQIKILFLALVLRLFFAVMLFMACPIRRPIFMTKESARDTKDRQKKALLLCFILFAAAMTTLGTVAAASLARPMIPHAFADCQSQRQQDSSHQQNIHRIHHQITPSARPISRTARAAIHATTHCHSATPAAHLPPSSRFTEAIAATQGV